MEKQLRISNSAMGVYNIAFLYGEVSQRRIFVRRGLATATRLGTLCSPYTRPLICRVFLRRVQHAKSIILKEGIYVESVVSVEGLCPSVAWTSVG